MLFHQFAETEVYFHISTLKCSDNQCFIIFNSGQSLLLAKLFIFRTINSTDSGGLMNQTANINIKF